MSQARYLFKLFVAGSSPHSVRAVANLQRLCQEHLQGDGFTIEIVDVLREPAHAEAERICLTPTLSKEFPLPRLRIVGDLSDARAVLEALRGGVL